MEKNIGFISTRFAGTDGVTLETSKWAQVLKQMGHQCFWFAGRLDKTPSQSMLVPEAFFQHEQNQWINEQILGKKARSSAVTDTIHNMKTLLKARIKEFIEKFSIDLLIPENALTIPMHVPLGIAITEIIAETQIPTIAHHHDFYWERTRFFVNAVGDYLRMAFPPNLPSLYEGFGNAFLEAIYFKKPILVNRYAIFVRDIEPKGFDLIGMDGFLTRKTVEKVREVLTSNQRKDQMVDHNYQVAKRYYSYSILRRWLNTLMSNFFGMEAQSQWKSDFL
ncbi:MAG: hypothetical protein JRF62_00690 [Deltaproteobacteria bacterium]|nr:hypothetical protein [Deltaproteobacteria bacterium]MBW2679419.1 hypothetical protein [Deltaproteobacteria bacterium]